MNAAHDDRGFAPSCERNRQPILNVLSEVLPEKANVVEVAAGTGEHAFHFTKAHPGWTWHPTDPDASALKSQRAWRANAAHARIALPVQLDVLDDDWPKTMLAAFENADQTSDESSNEEAARRIRAKELNVLFCANMIHISPWACTQALFQGAAQLLGDDAIVVTYGPYKKDGEFTSEGDVRFEVWLKEKDPRFGVRDVADVSEVAKKAGWIFVDEKEMPVNNKILVFNRMPN
ncbi:MAG: DUF938 domain-containing protein [Deltaproteobacteria bacterium]|nr:DUF938 domain-containing protein [Deltaproteobacteria bacterium]